jgi:2-polyprenyl-3-methyl-5-hydroxy-6-metoxy-1,4-benzoquinol methylase
MLSVLPRDLTGFEVIDIGCGAGVLSLALRRLGASVTAVDRFDEYSQDNDNQMGTTSDILRRFERVGITVWHRDILAEGVPENSARYDLVTSFAMIEHLPESPRAILAQCFKILKPGGQIVITTPNHAWIRTRVRLLAGASAYHPLDDWWRPPFYGHVREYTMSEVQAMLRWSGFEIKRTGLSSWQHVSSRIRGSSTDHTDIWTTRFTLHSLERLYVAASLCFSALIPSLRYSLFLVGKKPD